VAPTRFFKRIVQAAKYTLTHSSCQSTRGSFLFPITPLHFAAGESSAQPPPMSFRSRPHRNVTPLYLFWSGGVSTSSCTRT